MQLTPVKVERSRLILCRRIVSLDKELYLALFPSTQAPVVQKLDSAIHRINHYPLAKYQGNQLHCPLDRDLSGG